MFSKFHCWRCDTVTSEGKKCSTCGMAYYCSDRCRINDEFRHSSSECKDVAVRYVCHGCNKKTTENMMMCTNCMKVWFCDKECQKKAWKHHKHECQEISNLIAQLVYQVQFRYDRLITAPGMSNTYYWGNSPAIDLLKLSVNEGLEYKEPLSLLLCGVGDPRNVCLTISKIQEYQGKVTFVLNDICACTLARTVLLLYLLCKGGERAAESVTQIWYSLYLSEEDHEFAVAGLNDLIQISGLEVITHGIMKIGNDQLKRLKNVWKTWLNLSSEKIGLSKKRRHLLDIEEQKSSWGIKCYFSKMPARHRPSVKEWYKNGLLLAKSNGKKPTRENFTLMGSSTQFEHNAGSFKYSVPAACLPYQGWDYKTINAVYPKMNSVNEMYSTYISDVLKTCAARLQSDDIQLSFILSNCTDMTPYLPEGMTFDRITTSNLWDYIPLPRLLTLVKPLLNPVNTSAVILTNTMNWSSFYENLLESKLTALDLFPFSELRRNVLKDTGSSDIAYSSDGYAFMEYRSFLEEFTRFLRASLLISSDSGRAKSLIPSANQLAAELGLRPRDFTCRENKVAPFRWLLNCRRVTLMLGFDRTVEWILSN